MSASIQVSFDTRDVDGLVVDLERVSYRTAKRVADVVKQTSHDLRDTWRANAKVTARSHGKWYPRAITDEAESTDGLTWVIGPEKDRPQGGMGMGFEYGSRNQPPHLDGNIAADEWFPRFLRRVDVAVAEDLR